MPQITHSLATAVTFRSHGHPWALKQFISETITGIVAGAGLVCRHLGLPHPFDQKDTLKGHRT